MKEQQLLMVTTLIMDFQGAKVVTQVKEMLSPSHTILSHVLMTLCDIYIYVVEVVNTIGSPFMTGLRSRIFGCKSNRCKTSTI